MRTFEFVAAAVFVLLVAPERAFAQHENGGAAKAAESILPADVRRHVGVIADDSMGGRATPSPGLDRTAEYVASEFKRFALRPAGDDGSFIQRYPLDRVKIDRERSYASFTHEGVTVKALASRDLLYLSGGRTGSPISAPLFLAGGALDSAALGGLPVEGKIVMVVTGARNSNLTGRNRFLLGLLARRPAAVVIVSSTDTLAFARQVASQGRERLALGAGGMGGPPIVTVHERRVTALLDAAGVELASLRAGADVAARDIPAVRVTVSVRDEGSSPSAPNVVGILEGSDPVLRDEYVLFSAHMDHVGTNAAAKGDTIWNGADDDASGTAGVIELAEAFSRPGARPRRSLVFVTVSGEEKGLWGSDYFAANLPMPAGQVVAALNMDMIGRNWKDTIVAIGKEHSDLGATLDRVNAAHPELGIHAVDDLWPNENFYYRSDHFNFARRGIPVLFFFNGTHPDYHQPGDSPDKIDAEKEARILRLIYHLGAAVANADGRPKWKPESYKRIVR